MAAVDPLTVGLPVAAVLFLIAVAIYYLTRGGGDAFDKWYSTQRLLTDEEKKKKKTGSAKKVNKEKKQDTQAKEQKEDTVKSEKRISESEKSEEPVKEEEAKNNKKKNQKKKESKVEPISVDKKTVNGHTEKLKETSHNSQLEEDFTEIKPKQKKRSPEKNAEAHEEPQERPLQKTEVAPVKTEPLPKKPANTRKLEDMDIGKLLSDMIGGRVESVHIQFLKNFIDTNQKKEKAYNASAVAYVNEKNDLVKQLQAQTSKIKSLEDALRNHESDKASWEEKISIITNKEKILTTELQKQAQEIAALRNTVQTKENEVKHVRAEASGLVKSHQDAESNIQKLTGRIRELENSLIEAKQNAPQPIDNSAHIAVLEKENISIAAEKKSLEEKLSSEHKEWEEKHSRLMEEYLAIQQLCDQLKEEVKNFEKWKTELDKSTKEVEAQKAEIAKVHEAQKHLQAENNTLRKTIEQLNKEIAFRPPDNTNLGEEIVVLKKSDNLMAAPPSAPSDTELKLREENQRLQSKNEELRERNFKLADMIEQATSSTPAKKEESKTETFEKMKKDSKNDKKNQKRELTENSTPSKNTPDAQLTKSYRDALIAVKFKLSDISELAEQRQKIIEQLEAQVKSSQMSPGKSAATLPKASPPTAPTLKKKASSVAGSDKSGEENDWELVY